MQDGTKQLEVWYRRLPEVLKVRSLGPGGWSWWIPSQFCFSIIFHYGTGKFFPSTKHSHVRGLEWLFFNIRMPRSLVLTSLGLWNGNIKEKCILQKLYMLSVPWSTEEFYHKMIKNDHIQWLKKINKKTALISWQLPSTVWRKVTQSWTKQ